MREEDVGLDMEVKFGWFGVRLSLGEDHSGFTVSKQGNTVTRRYLPMGDLRHTFLCLLLTPWSKPLRMLKSEESGGRGRLWVWGRSCRIKDSNSNSHSNKS